MTDHELDELLRRASVPERDSAYWEAFPSQVTRQIKDRECAKDSPPEWQRRPKFALAAWGIGLAAACIAIGFTLGFWKGKTTRPETQMAAMQKYYREVAALFPNQLQAVILDEKGPRLVLADAADVPNSTPIFVRICQADHCEKFITFSGQQIQVNGEKFDVLSDAQGHIILAGQKLAWSSSQPGTGNSPYRIQARWLEERAL